jgi:hypothetical protein
MLVVSCLSPGCAAALPGLVLRLAATKSAVGTESGGLNVTACLALYLGEGLLSFPTRALLEGYRMTICAACRQPIKETVAAGRKLIAKVHTGPHSEIGRYLTILSLRCACGERIDRRYENRSNLNTTAVGVSVAIPCLRDTTALRAAPLCNH